MTKIERTTDKAKKIIANNKETYEKERNELINRIENENKKINEILEEKNYFKDLSTNLAEEVSKIKLLLETSENDSNNKIKDLNS